MQGQLFNLDEIPVTETLRDKRNATIRAEFETMTQKKHLAIDYVLNELSKKYFLEPRTVWLIVSETGRYQKKTA